MIRISLNVKSQRTKTKFRFSPKGPTTPKNLRCETLYIADYIYVNISSFAVLGIKLWLEDNVDLKRDDLSNSFKFIQSKAQVDTNCYHLLAMTLCTT